MSYSIQAAINDFDSVVLAVAPSVSKKPAYIAARNGLGNYLQILKPLVSGEFLYTAEEIQFLHDFNRYNLSVEDPNANERALYCGIMAFYTLMLIREREKYPIIDLKMLSERWVSEMVFPKQALARYVMFESVNRNALNLLAAGFLDIHVQPRVRDPQKLEEATAHFDTQFFSGVLLCQIETWVTLKNARQN